MPKRSLTAVAPELPVAPRAWTTATRRLQPTVREASFLLAMLVSIAWSWTPLSTVLARSLAYSDENYSHIAVIPFVVAYLLFLERERIGRRAEWGRAGLAGGTGLVVAGASVVWFAANVAAGRDVEHGLSVAMVGVVAMWTGGFVLSYGLRGAQTAAFPLTILLFMVPFPPPFLASIIHALQRGSAEAADVLFELLGMPFVRDGFVFALPGITIQVAEECSGLRSSLALVVTGLVMGHLFLRSTWTRLTLALVIVPVAILKNAIRIVLLSWLAINVDPSFLTGSALHQRGGILFFISAFLLLAALALILRRCEGRAKERRRLVEAPG